MSSCHARFGQRNEMQVELISLKQGTYESQLASYLLVEITEAMTKSIRQTRFDFEIGSAQPSTVADPSNKPFSLAAYGPAHIVSPPRAKVKVPASIEMRETPAGGLQLTVTRSQPGNVAVPFRLTMGMVVVHSSIIRLTVYATYDTLQRLLALVRFDAIPLFIDLATEFHPMPTCARGEQDCHTSCSEFGPDHMSPAFWHKLFARWAVDRIAGESNPTWVRYSTKQASPQQQESS